MQEYKIGEMLRKKYDAFLGTTYRPEDIFAYCSDTNRTKDSLAIVLASLYQPPDKFKWKSDLNWSPIPANVVPRKLDVILNSFLSKQ